MNVAVINLKDILRYFIKILIAVVIMYIGTKLISNSGYNLKQIIWTKTDNRFLTYCLELSMPTLKTINDEEEKQISITNIMKNEIALLNPDLKKQEIKTEDGTSIAIEEPIKQVETASPDVQIPKVAETKEVSDRNFKSSATDTYSTTRIDNQSDYTLTEEMLVPNVEITNKKNVVIYHTHTCESYTPSEGYEYTMTGTYRTTDSNFNVVRVGRELTNCLTEKGFNVVHDETYHDYPAYSGSYARSLETAEKVLYENPSDIVIDLHRDAVGNGDTYGPTVMVNGQRVAQLMFVIGTNGGGLEHPNWNENLKIAIKIQEKANQMYPGLFRSMIIRNSRYNQHLAKGASIIEVGATANTLDECLLSMQCLANVLEEVCK